MWSLSGKALLGVFRLHETTETRPVFGRGLADPVRHTTLCRRRGRYRGLYVGNGHGHVRVRFQNVFRAPLEQAGSRRTFASSGIAARGDLARWISLCSGGFYCKPLPGKPFDTVWPVFHGRHLDTVLQELWPLLGLTIYTQNAKCQ